MKVGGHCFQHIVLPFLNEEEFIAGGCFDPEAFDIVLQFLLIEVNGRNDLLRIEFFDEQYFIHVKTLGQFLVGNFIVAVRIDETSNLSPPQIYPGILPFF